jgi:hypothetical protein
MSSLVCYIGLRLASAKFNEVDPGKFFKRRLGQDYSTINTRTFDSIISPEISV